jgi:dehydrodolichyl diphosphate syntase complex subunit NUS1
VLLSQVVKFMLTTYSHLPDNKGVNYQVFLRALYNFAKVEMRLGR